MNSRSPLFDQRLHDNEEVLIGNFVLVAFAGGNDGNYPIFESAFGADRKTSDELPEDLALFGIGRV